MYFSLYRSGWEYRWRLVAGNNRIIADSGEGYNNKTDCLHAIGLVVGTNAATTIYDHSDLAASR